MAKKKQPTKKVRPGSAQDVPDGFVRPDLPKNPGTVNDTRTMKLKITKHEAEMAAVYKALKQVWGPKPRKRRKAVTARKGKAQWGFYNYFRPHKPQVAPEPAAPAPDPSTPPEAPKRGERQAVRKDPVADLDAAIASEVEVVARLSKLSITPVTLHFRYFGAGPGLGGMSRLSVHTLKRSVKVRFRADVTNAAEKDVTVLTLPTASDWRPVIEAIGDESNCALWCDGSLDEGYPWPAKMETDGADSLFVELLKLAWAGPPLSEIATALAVASDGQLATLRASSGPFTSRRFLQQLLRIKEGLSPRSLANVIARMPTKGFGLSEVRRGARAAAVLARAKQHMVEAQQAWDLLGFEADIERVVASWRQRNPATSANTAIGRGAQSSALEVYLREVVVRQRALPTGSHTIGSWTGTFTVDFDSL